MLALAASTDAAEIRREQYAYSSERSCVSGGKFQSNNAATPQRTRKRPSTRVRLALRRAAPARKSSSKPVAAWGSKGMMVGPASRRASIFRLDNLDSKSPFRAARQWSRPSPLARILNSSHGRRSKGTRGSILQPRVRLGTRGSHGGPKHRLHLAFRLPPAARFPHRLRSTPTSTALRLWSPAQKITRIRDAISLHPDAVVERGNW